MTPGTRVKRRKWERPREEKRTERARAKKAFQDLLTEAVPSLWAAAASSSSQGPTFDAIRDKLAKDDRFYAVDEESTRVDLFYEFCDDLRKRDDQKKKNSRRDAKANFLAFLKEKEEAQAASVTQFVPPRFRRLAILPATTLPSRPGKELSCQGT